MRLASELMRTSGSVLVAALTVALPLVLVAGPPRAERGVSAATSSYAAHAPGEDALVQFAGGTIRVDFNQSGFAVGRADLLEWVRQSARATTAYFGRFPVPYARLTIEPIPGDEVTMGYALGRPEPRIVVKMGRRTSAAELRRESLLVHEMVHLAVPDHDVRFIWLHEGIATYVEHVARAQAGIVRAEAVWAELMRELPEGLPNARATGGLDGTESEGRRYWGGALFCLLADIEIRKATGNRLGLQDALRALQRQGGNLSRLWTLERTLEVADRGTGTSALSSLYRLMGNRPHTPDLDGLWRDLGVRKERGRIVLDDTAPLAAIRRAITDQPSAPLLVAKPQLVRVVNLRAQAGR